MRRTIVCASLLYIMIKKTILIIFLISLLKTSISQEEIKVLWLGNSYTYVNNLPNIVNELSFGTNKTVTSESVCPGGCTLFQHAENITSLKAISKGCWDYVVLQEQSQLPSIDYYRHNAMKPAYKALYDTIMLHNPNAKVVGYMTWGRRFGGQQCEDYGEGLHCSADFTDFNHMQDSLSAAYCENAYYTNSYVSPVGDAWKESLCHNKNLILHSTDDSHPNYYGSYLAACVFHALFWNETPIGSYYDSTYIDKRDASFLQNIAHDVFFNNLEQWNFDTDTDTTHVYNNVYNDTFKIISNPDDDNITIKNKSNTSAKVKIIDINGIVVLEKNIIEDEILHINNSKGIYIIQITEQKSREQFVQKILKT